MDCKDSATVEAERTRGRFLILLISLSVYLFVVPMLYELARLRFLFDTFFSIFLIAVVYMLSLRASGLAIGLIFAVPMIASIWLAYFLDLAAFSVGSHFFAVFFIAYAAWVILRYILTQERITADIIYAAIVVYLLIGQIYLAVLLARLVGMHISQAQTTRKDK